MAMKSTQAWGWLAAGVLALGLNGIYQDGGAAWAHRAVHRVIARIGAPTEGVLALASGHAERFMATSRLVAARDETASCRLATAMARAQTKMARAQVQIARMHIAPAAFNPTVCPRMRVSIPNVRISVPGMRVETAGLLNE
jgi:hypothetical protein